MKRKVGDTVTIKNDLEVGKKYGVDIFDNHMLPYLGRKAKITKIYEHKNKYDLDIDDGGSYWTNEMFEDENKLNTDMKKHQFKVGDKVELPKTKSIGVEYFDEAIKELLNIAKKEKRDFYIITEIRKSVENNIEDVIIGLENRWNFKPKDLVLYKEEKNISNIENDKIKFITIVNDKNGYKFNIKYKDNKPKDCLDNTVKIINGIFKGMTGIIVGIHMGEPSCLIADIKIDNNNILHINIDDIKNVYENGTKTALLSDDGKLYNVKVTARNRRTTVALTDHGIKASIYCHKDDEYDYVQGRTLAFKKALAKKYKSEYEKAIKD
jgi:hypothetical protein